MEFTLNGRAVSVAVREGTSLLEILREGCGVTSVKDGCAPEGSCGACTVIVDGKAVVCCAQKATRVEGKEVTTQDGLSRATGALGPCFVAAGASQCGFCSPGIVMKAEAMLAKNPTPSRDEVARGARRQPLPLHRVRQDRRRRGAGGRAPGAASRSRSSTAAAASDPGGPVQGMELALGDKPYINDMRPGHAPRRPPLLRSPAGPGPAHRHVEGRGPPGRRGGGHAARRAGRAYQGDIIPDWRQFVAEGEVTRVRRRRPAAVAAETRARPHARRPRWSRWSTRCSSRSRIRSTRWSRRPAHRRLSPRAATCCRSRRCKRGDVDAALAGAAHVVHETFRTQFIEHAFLEPESVARRARRSDGGAPRLLAGPGRVARPSSRSPRSWAARGAGEGDPGVERRCVRSQGGPELQCHAALLARRTGRPVLGHAVPQGEPAVPLQAPPD